MHARALGGAFSRRRANRLLKITLICTTRRRIPASAITNQGHAKGDLIREGVWLTGASRASRVRSKREQHKRF